MTFLYVNREKWHQVVTVPSREEETACVKYVQDNWQYTDDASYRGDYVKLFSNRYPHQSRDYQDDGFYIELVGKPNQPLAVAYWNWSHCSCYNWDDHMKGPDNVYMFSSYMKLRSNDYACDTLFFLGQMSLNETWENDREDREMYAYWQLVHYLKDKPGVTLVSGEQFNKLSQDIPVTL